MSGGGVGSSSGGEKDKDSHWYFTAEQLANSPSRRHGIDSDTELSYRQMTAYLIQEMGQRLQVSQLCINTAIVYMHRFYAFHSFTHFHRNSIAAASLFLAAKVEEQPRKLEHVIKAANKCLNQPSSSTTDAYYMEQAQELVFNENVLLQTLGFDVAIDHPHTHVVKTCHLVKACKDLAQTSYFLASNSLHLTSMCLQYKPTVVACFCIYLACKWSRWESTEGKHWFHYVDKTVTMDLLKQLTEEFIAIYEKSPSRLKSKLNSIKALAQGASSRVINKEKKAPAEEWKMVDMLKMYHSAGATNDVPISSSISSGNQLSHGSANTSDQQQSSAATTALLPPPQPQPQQQIRKSESHSSSQHRSHHNSSTHHAKIGFPSGDVLDHKSSHKQQPFGVNATSRPRDHSQTSQSHQSSMMPVNSSRSSLSSSSGRSSSSITGQSMPRQSSQSHQLDMNYHKSREKPNNLMGSFSLPAIPPAHPGHKVSQKQDSNRVIQKEQSVGKLPEQGKQVSNKMFPPSSMSMPPQFGSGQLPSGPQLQSKLDMGQDLSRSMMHGQRGYGMNNSSSGMPLIGYPQQHSRQSTNSNSSSNNNSSSSKHDPSKPVSVHMQQQQQQQQHSKQSIPPEPSHSNVAHEQQQSHTHSQAHPSTNYLNMRPPDTIHNEDVTSQMSIHALLQQHASTQPKPITSMFSPEFNDKTQQQQPQQQQQQLHQPASSGNNYGTMPAPMDAFNYKTSTSTKESPKKVERDRLSEANIKKERNRTGPPVMDPNTFLPAVRSSAQQQQQQQQTLKINKKMEIPNNHGELAGTSGGLNAPLKRPNEGVIKQEDEPNKIRKIDASLPQSYNDTKNATDISKHQVVNGIETNPDLVRNLLKESLCTSSALLKTEQLGLLPPAELFEPTATNSSLKSSAASSGTEPTPMESSDASGSKAEKKKKKDKHKHKEKDKSKDREERKKHKKDKDKHKDRDRDRESDNSEHVKIKIIKDKIEGASGSAESLKIKIPKDRITTDVNSSVGGSNAPMQIANPADASSMQPAPALKIKILKDKLENYSSGATDTAHAAAQAHAMAQLSTTGFYASFVTPGNNGSSTSSHSSKKKDRDRDKDREREKEKKRASNEFAKSNGGGVYPAMMATTCGSGGGGGGGGTMSGQHAPTAATSKSQNSNKMQLLSNNMNQLFGESNDDDDDDDDDYDCINDDLRGGYAKSYKEYQKSVSQKHATSLTLSDSNSNTNSYAGTTTSAAAMRKGIDYGTKHLQTQQHTTQHHMQQQQLQR